MADMFTQTALKEFLHYDPATGVFTWLVSRGKAKAGGVSGCLDTHGYCVITLSGVQYGAHRLAFLYMTGAWPTELVDHRDGIRNNNRWANLREATPSQNMHNSRIQRNNKSGLKGVYLFRGRWKATIGLNSKLHHLGMFDTAEEAHAIYVRAARDMHGQFARTA